MISSFGPGFEPLHLHKLKLQRVGNNMLEFSILIQQKFCHRIIYLYICTRIVVMQADQCKDFIIPYH